MSDYFEIQMPEGSKVLSVSTEGITAYMFAMVNTDRPTEVRAFSICGTAVAISAKAYTNLYIGTCVISGNECHLFEASKS